MESIFLPTDDEVKEVLTSRSLVVAHKDRLPWESVFKTESGEKMRVAFLTFGQTQVEEVQLVAFTDDEDGREMLGMLQGGKIQHHM